MKEFKTYQQQLLILKKRGLIISNQKFAINKLSEIGYYNLINAYKIPFLNPTISEDEYYYHSFFM